MAKAQEQILQGHDLSGKERFRFYLSDEGYRNAKRSEQEREIKIKSHAAVVAGKLYPNKKPKQQEREKSVFKNQSAPGASCGQQMISVDFQSAPIITGEAALRDGR